MGKTIIFDYVSGKAPDDLYIDKEFLANLSEKELHERAKSDPDAQPLSDEQLQHFKRVNPNLPCKEAS